ncbi:MAG: heterodisulfide reductase-related iron-sulfur binding cluster, partial [Halobacteriales archaeon]
AHLLGSAAVADLAASTYTPLSYLAAIDASPAVDPADDHLVLHRHCHGQSVGATDPTAGVLLDLGYDVEEVDSGCCGMAGSFGYEVEHHDLSLAIGAILRDQLEALAPEAILAAGSSCRTQLGDLGVDAPVTHPVARVAGDLA